MEASLYQQHLDLEDRHWWFIARRHIVETLLKRFIEPPLSVVEGGCGTGGNLAMLTQFGTLQAFELEKVAREAAEKRGLCEVRFGALPDAYPFETCCDVLALMDVLEHIEADEASLKVLYKKLNQGGKLLLTVPAYAFLWSAHDEVNHHKRRYTRKNLIQKVERAGFNVNYASYYNTFLFPIVLFVRLMHKLTKRPESSDLVLPSPFVNQALTRIFATERFFLPYLRFPFGVSIVLIAEKP